MGYFGRFNLQFFVESRAGEIIIWGLSRLAMVILVELSLVV